MKNNIFHFADTYWLQLTGTAMGTPTACSYASITYGQHENNYRRYIDDIFGIWVPPTTNNIETWEMFKTKLNSWGKLEWVVETPSHHTVFLDLNLQMIDNKIHTNTFQKALNLYLYIPPRSAHPPSCLKGLVTGEL